MKNKLNKKFFIYVLLFKIIFITNVYSDIIKGFEISGNDRVSNETIIMFSNLKIGQNINSKVLNDSLKELYSTNYFKSVSITSDEGVINLTVKENPIIQSVIINGLDDKSILENITKITQKLEKYPFVENKIKDQIKLLKNILKSYGYYFVELESSILKNKNNTIDLVYNFNLGKIAKIKKIKFIGNKFFKDRVLRNVIVSEEAKFWKFITRNKFLDTNRINLDVSRLNNFYKNRGFFNVKIKSTSAIITNKDQFELIFNIDSGNKYYFNDINISNNNVVPIKSLDKFVTNFNDLKGKKYSQKILNNLVDDINNFTIQNDFVFINVKYKEIVRDDNKVDIIFDFEDFSIISILKCNLFLS